MAGLEVSFPGGQCFVVTWRRRYRFRVRLPHRRPGIAYLDEAAGPLRAGGQVIALLLQGLASGQAFDAQRLGDLGLPGVSGSLQDEGMSQAPAVTTIRSRGHGSPGPPASSG